MISYLGMGSDLATHQDFFQTELLTREGTLEQLVPTFDITLLQAIVEVTLSSFRQFLVN